MIDHAKEKLYLAVYELVTGEASLKERLGAAAHLDRVRPEQDLPADLRDEFTALRTAIAKGEGQTRDLATEIVALYGEVRGSR